MCKGHSQSAVIVTTQLLGTIESSETTPWSVDVSPVCCSVVGVCWCKPATAGVTLPSWRTASPSLPSAPLICLLPPPSPIASTYSITPPQHPCHLHPPHHHRLITPLMSPPLTPPKVYSVTLTSLRFHRFFPPSPFFVPLSLKDEEGRLKGRVRPIKLLSCFLIEWWKGVWGAAARLPPLWPNKECPNESE